MALRSFGIIFWIIGLSSGMARSLETFSNENPACAARYCSKRNAYCSADCCECICSHGLVYSVILKMCHVPILATTTVAMATTIDVTPAPFERTSQTAINVVQTTLPPSSKTTAAAAHRGSSSNTGGVIAGAVVGVLAILIIMVVLTMILFRRRRKAQLDSGPSEKGFGDVTHTNGDLKSSESSEPNPPIYAYADLSPNLSTAGRSESNSSKSAILPRGSPDVRPLTKTHAYDYATDVRPRKPPLAPRPISLTDPRSNRLQPGTTSPLPRRPLTLSGDHFTHGLIPEPTGNRSPRREAPKPPDTDSTNGIVPFYHVLDQGVPALDEPGAAPDDLYEVPSSTDETSTVKHTSEDAAYRELNYAHMAGVYQTLVPPAPFEVTI